MHFRTFDMLFFCFGLFFSGHWKEPEASANKGQDAHSEYEMRFVCTWERWPLSVFLVPALLHDTDHLVALLWPLLRYHVHAGSLAMWHLEEDRGHAAPWHHKTHRCLDLSSANTLRIKVQSISRGISRTSIWLLLCQNLPDNDPKAGKDKRFSEYVHFFFPITPVNACVLLTKDELKKP